MTSQPPSYRGYRFPSEIISHAVWLYYRFGLSFRDVEDLLAERGITVTYEAIRLWCRTFGLNYARRLRRRRGRQGDTWYLDELFVKIQGAAAVSVACRGRGRRRPRHSRAVAAQSAGGHTVLPEAVETPRPRASPADHRQAAQLLGGAPSRDAVRDPQYPAVRKQSRGSLASINPPAGAADAQVQVGRPSATVRLGARRRPESLPGRTSPAPGSSPPSLEGPFVPSVG